MLHNGTFGVECAMKDARTASSRRREEHPFSNIISKLSSDDFDRQHLLTVAEDGDVQIIGNTDTTSLIHHQQPLSTPLQSFLPPGPDRINQEIHDSQSRAHRLPLKQAAPKPFNSGITEQHRVHYRIVPVEPEAAVTSLTTRYDMYHACYGALIGTYLPLTCLNTLEVCP